MPKINLPKLKIKLIKRNEKNIVLEVVGLGKFYSEHEIPPDVMHNILDIIKRYNDLALSKNDWLTPKEIEICVNHILLYLREEINNGKIRKNTCHEDLIETNETDGEKDVAE